MKRFRQRRIFLIILIILIFLFSRIIFSYYFQPRDINRINLEEIDMKKEKLNTKDYLEDFDFAYSTLEKYYPYFEINKEVNKIDWLKNKDYYRQYISQAINDQDFYFRMNDILMDLNNGHTSLLDESRGIDMYLTYYPMPRYNRRHDLANIYEKEGVRRRYMITNERIKEYMDLNYLKVLDHKKNPSYFALNKSKEDDDQFINSNNLDCRDLVDGKIAYIKISSMLTEEYIEEDAIVLDEYLQRIKNYPVLILDIRGNGGGDSRYWQEFLLPKIIDKKYQQISYNFIKKGDLFKKVIKQENYKPGVEEFLKSQDFPQKSKDLMKNYDYYNKNISQVSPDKDSINFKGKIYLLVDPLVYSSSEMLASFAKESGLATLVGEKTGGDGIGTDPYQIALPKTSYVLRFSKELGATEKGSISELDQTEPDIEVDSSNKLILEKQPIIKKILDLENQGWHTFFYSYN